MRDAGVIRVFPRRTNATPVDEMAYVGDPPLYRQPAEDIREVHVSAVFTWDMAEARRLAEAWRQYYSVVRLAGPAFGDPGGEFEPGMYLKDGYVITSRGCPHRCGFCLVPKREGRLRVLRVRTGWEVLDNNLLACPEDHIEAVFDMLRGQPKPPVFSGGLEAARVTPAMAERLVSLRFDIAYTAFDRPAQARDVELAVRRLRDAGGWSLRRAQRKLGCYVLCGYQGDSIAAIEKRLEWICELGATPFPMLYRAPRPRKDPEIDEMKRALVKWMRPARIFHKGKQARKEARLPVKI